MPDANEASRPGVRLRAEPSSSSGPSDRSEPETGSARDSGGIAGLLIETHNWGKTVALWQGLGYVLEFETDHHSGQLRHPRGGPFLFVAERPPHHALQIVPMIAIADAAAFTPPPAATVVRGFERQHWPVDEMLLGDPDGRSISVQAPAEAPHE